MGLRALSKFSGLDLSAATVRNVMSDLQDLGFIASPHTSAGRVPTSRGYRFFVDSLLTIKPLKSEKIHTIEGHLHPSHPQQLISNASHLVSELTHFSGSVLTPRRKPPKIRQVEFVSLSEKRILLTERPYSPSELIVATNHLNQYFAGNDFEHIRNRVKDDLLRLHVDLQDLMSAALAAGDDAMNESEERYIISGERHLLEVEELSSNMKRLRELFDLFANAPRSCNCWTSRTVLMASRYTLAVNPAWRGSMNAAASPPRIQWTARSSVQLVSSDRHAWPTNGSFQLLTSAKLLSSTFTYRANY